jgi:hypothetical protein
MSVSPSTSHTYWMSSISRVTIRMALWASSMARLNAFFLASAFCFGVSPSDADSDADEDLNV